MANEKVTQSASVSIIKDNVNRMSQTVDQLNANQLAISQQQTELRTAQSAVKDRLDGIEHRPKQNDNDDRFSDLEAKIKSLETTVDNIRASSTNDPVFFSANPTKSFGTNGQPVPFDKMLAESNSGFDGSSGIMTVKIAGIYHFVATVMPYSGSV